MEVSLERPPHVAQELVRDFDYYHVDDGSLDIQKSWWEMAQRNPPIFWTPYNGGHWVATQASDIETILSDYSRFSHSSVRVPNLDTPVPLLPLETDPPEHGKYRALVAPFFAPRPMAAAEAFVRKVAIETIESLVPKGECEFIGDFAKVLPVVVFLSIIQLPPEERIKLLPFADVVARSDDPTEVLEARAAVANYLLEVVQSRRSQPGNDPISLIVHAQVDGRPITEKEVLGLCSKLLLGGLDTVTSFLGFAAKFLATHPDHRHQLMADPSLIPNAVEELIRRHGIISIGPTVVDDIEYRGVQLRKGDQILVPNLLYGLDSTINAEPLTVDFTRAKPRHAAFGRANHLCPGAHLARRELTVFVQEWLARIPDFQIKEGTRPVMSSGVVSALRELWLSW